MVKLGNNQNAITVYLERGDEDRVAAVAKKIGLNKSSFCRMAVLQKINELKEENS